MKRSLLSAAIIVLAIAAHSTCLANDYPLYVPDLSNPFDDDLSGDGDWYQSNMLPGYGSGPAGTTTQAVFDVWDRMYQTQQYYDQFSAPSTSYDYP